MVGLFPARRTLAGSRLGRSERRLERADERTEGGTVDRVDGALVRVRFSCTSRASFLLPSLR